MGNNNLNDAIGEQEEKDYHQLQQKEQSLSDLLNIFPIEHQKVQRA